MTVGAGGRGFSSATVSWGNVLHKSAFRRDSGAGLPSFRPGLSTSPAQTALVGKVGLGGKFLAWSEHSRFFGIYEHCSYSVGFIPNYVVHKIATSQYYSKQWT